MTLPAGDKGWSQPSRSEARLQAIGSDCFIAAVQDDAGLRRLLAAYDAQTASFAPHLPPASRFQRRDLLVYGMTARTEFLNSEPSGRPPAVVAALFRAAAGPRLHLRPAYYRLVTVGEAEVFLVLLPLSSGQQGEVVEVLAAFGR